MWGVLRECGVVGSCGGIGDVWCVRDVVMMWWGVVVVYEWDWCVVVCCVGGVVVFMLGVLVVRWCSTSRRWVHDVVGVVAGLLV